MTLEELQNYLLREAKVAAEEARERAALKIGDRAASRTWMHYSAEVVTNINEVLGPLTRKFLELCNEYSIALDDKTLDALKAVLGCVRSIGEGALYSIPGNYTEYLHRGKEKLDDETKFLMEEAAKGRYRGNTLIIGKATRRTVPAIGFDDLLHPAIGQVASYLYASSDFRNAVLDAITAVFDKIRERTGLDLDGDALINRALSVERPFLVLSEVDTQSGKNDQSGFADILRGFYRGVRNPKAHSLNHDLDALKAGQHLVLASLLMRRIIEARDTRAISAER